MPSSVGRLATLLAVFLVGGCGDLTGPDSLPRARRLWNAQSHASYQYVGTRSCFCPDPFGPVNVTVVNDQVVSVVDLVGAFHPTAGWLTIDGIFDEAERAITDGRLIGIEFDDDEGYPTRVDICCQENDSGISRGIARLTPLGPIPAGS